MLKDRTGRIRVRKAPFGLFAAMALSLLLADAGYAQSPGAPAASMSRFVAQAPITVTLSSLPTATVGSTAASPPVHLGARHGLPDVQYRQRKGQISRGGPSAIRQGGMSDLSPTDSFPPVPPPQLPKTAFGRPTPQAAIVFNGQQYASCGNAVPADMALAVGDTTNSVLAANSNCVSVYSKTGSLVHGPVTLQAFAGLPADWFVDLPRALYDWANHRFIVAFAAFSTDNTTFYIVAVSRADDPTGAWNVYRLQTAADSGNFIDFPRLGQDRQGIYVAGNLFDAVYGTFNKEEWLLLPKELMYAGATFTANSVLGPSYAKNFLDSSQPASVQSPHEEPRAAFFVTSLNINYNANCSFASCNGLVVWAVSNPLVASGSPGPEVTGIFLPTTYNYSLPPSANQPGFAESIDSGDTRISGQVTYQSGLLYAALTTDSSAIVPTQGSGTNAVILYKIHPSLNDNDDARCTGSFANLCPQLTAAAITSELCFACGGFTDTGGGAYYPTTMPDPEGNWTLVYNYSSNAAYPSTAYLSNRVTQTGIHDSGLIAGAGQATYLYFFWGGYTAVALAGLQVPQGVAVYLPSMWFAGMLSLSDGTWGTVIGKNGYSGYDQP